METDAGKLSILILIRTETVDRLENVLAVVRFITKNMPYQVSILECTPFCNGILQRLLPKEIKYTFIEDHDPVLHRTYYINQMASEAKTPFITIWDADIVIAPHQVFRAMEMLQHGEADFVIPYEKQALDTTPILRRLFLQDEKWEILEQNKDKMIEMYAPNPLGGVFIANSASYKMAGLENEDFYGWGMEDGERYYRWLKLGYKIRRVPGPLYHLSHGRGINSKFQNTEQEFFKRKETLKAKRMAGNDQNS